MINYDGRRFRDPGKPDAPVAVYRQSGDLMWADFAGGAVRRGSVCGRCDSDGHLEFGYIFVMDSGEVVTGRCLSTPTVLPDGRIHLLEQWERYGPAGRTGTSELEEIPVGADDRQVGVPPA